MKSESITGRSEAKVCSEVQDNCEVKNGQLSFKQQLAIIKMLEQPTLAKAAEAVGVSEVTLWRWLQVSEFQQCLRAARRQVFSQALGNLQTIVGDAVKALHDIASDSGAAPSTRIAAARAIIDYGLRADENDDLGQRVEQLESAQTAAPRTKRASSTSEINQQAKPAI